MSSIYITFINLNISAKREPFNIQFLSDAIEMANEAKVNAKDTNQDSSGFQLAYIMSAANCW